MTRFDWPIPFGTPVIETETGWRGMVVAGTTQSQRRWVHLYALDDVDLGRMTTFEHLNKRFAPLTSPLRPRKP